MINEKQIKRGAKRLNKRLDDRARKEGVPGWKLLHKPMPEMPKRKK